MLVLGADELRPAGDEGELAICGEQRVLFGQALRQGNVAGVLPRDQRAARGGAAGDEGAGEAAVLLMDHAHAVVARGALVEERAGSIGRTVVDGDELEVDAALGEDAVEGCGKTIAG